MAPDALKALGELGGYWRHQQLCKIIAIAGSNGKTTIKEMMASILKERKVKYDALWSCKFKQFDWLANGKLKSYI